MTNGSTEPESGTDSITDGEAPRPSRRGYWAALALLVVGVAVFFSTLLPARQAVHDAVTSLQRGVLNGETPVVFEAERPGVFTLYYEKRSVVSGRPVSSPLLWDGLPLVVIAEEARGLPQGERVEPRVWSGTGTETGRAIYRVGPFVGESLYTVEVPAPGTYRVEPDDELLAILEAEQPRQASFDQPRVVAVGNVPVELLKSGLSGVYGGAVVLGLAFTAAVVVALITWARRHPVDTSRRSNGDAQRGTLSSPVPSAS